MKKTFLVISAVIALTAYSNNVLAQRGSDRCELYVVDADAKKEVMLEKFTTIVGEEELTSKSFRFLKTGLFITASVYYTDESMASENGNDSMMLGLAVSEKPLTDALTVLNNTFAEVTLATLDTVRVKKYHRMQGKVYLIGIECSKGKHEDIH